MNESKKGKPEIILFFETWSNDGVKPKKSWENWIAMALRCYAEDWMMSEDHLGEDLVFYQGDCRYTCCVGLAEKANKKNWQEIVKQINLENYGFSAVMHVM